VLARAVEAEDHVALFSHGHFLRVLGARWIGLDATDGRVLGLDVATLSVLGYERAQRVLRTWNA
jgi:probable phosphoglycerate mutase